MKSLVLALVLVVPLAGRADPNSCKPADYRGKVVLITFFSQYTRDEAQRVNDTIERRAPKSGVSLISVFDLAGIPSGLHEYARGRLAKATEGRRIRYLVDDGGLCRIAHGANPAGQIDILVLDRNGTVLRHYIGEQRVPEALAAVAQLSER